VGHEMGDRGFAARANAARSRLREFPDSPCG
jgi:hypothetical protein